jgi:hypothetical protein
VAKLAGVTGESTPAVSQKVPKLSKKNKGKFSATRGGLEDDAAAPNP